MPYVIFYLYTEASSPLTQITDVKCDVSCVGCKTLLTTVASLKRHTSECTALKELEHDPNTARTFRQMKAQVAMESKKASARARESLPQRTLKRRNTQVPDKLSSRKKSRLNIQSDTGSHREKLEARLEPRDSLGSNNISTQSLQTADRTALPNISHENLTFANKGNEMMDQVSLYLHGGSCETLQNPSEAADYYNSSIALSRTPEAYVHNEYHAQGLTDAGSVQSQHDFATQHPIVEEPVSRGMSFRKHTMDGPWYFGMD